METSDNQFASETLKQLQAEFRVEVVADWGTGSDGAWQSGQRDKDGCTSPVLSFAKKILGLSDSGLTN